MEGAGGPRAGSSPEVPVADQRQHGAPGFRCAPPPPGLRSSLTLGERPGLLFFQVGRESASSSRSEEAVEVPH